MGLDARIEKRRQLGLAVPVIGTVERGVVVTGVTAELGDADPDLLVSASEDGTVWLWSLSQRRNVTTLVPFGGADVRTVSLSRDGRTLDMLGIYDPASPKPDLRLRLDVERAAGDPLLGALPSDTVRSIFKREGVYTEAPARKPRRPGPRPRPTSSGGSTSSARRCSPAR